MISGYPHFRKPSNLIHCTFQDKALHGTLSFVRKQSRPQTKQPRLRQKSQQCFAEVPVQHIGMVLIWPYPLEGIGVVGPKMHLSMYSQRPSSIESKPWSYHLFYGLHDFPQYMLKVLRFADPTVRPSFHWRERCMHRWSFLACVSVCLCALCVCARMPAERSSKAPVRATFWISYLGSHLREMTQRMPAEVTTVVFTASLM